MAKTENRMASLNEVGQKLVGRSKSTERTDNRGLVVQLFPFIYEASFKMSARAISRFLQEDQNIKLSAVTITKALNDPKKHWIAFFETIEPPATVIASWFKPKSFKYLFLGKTEYEHRIAPKTDGFFEEIFVKGARALLYPERVAANKEMLEKWFSIGLGIRLKAKPYLEEYLMSLEDKL